MTAKVLPPCTLQNAGEVIVVGDDLLRCEGNAWRRVTDGALFVELEGKVTILPAASEGTAGRGGESPTASA